jgi:hypothetical protein
MIRFFRELYLTAFIIIIKIPSRKGNNFGKIGGAIGAITVVEWLNIVNISSWLDIFAGKQVLPRFSELELLIAGFTLFLSNQYILFTAGHGTKFEREFDDLNKNRRTILVVSCVALLLATIIFSVYSTSAYHQFLRRAAISSQ